MDAQLHKIASLALEAMLYEAAATPKPGLVDRVNCGAHRDMDFFTFMASAAALHSAFDAMTLAGSSACGASSPRAMWPSLREAGRGAEARMFEATHGVNTHKGEIFSLGLLCGCAGWLTSRGGRLSAENLTALAAEMCQGLCERELTPLREREARTKGEQMYLRYGCTGIRGEAESGFKTVREVSLPVFRELMTGGTSVNDALVQTLLHLISGTADTNILSRHNMETAEQARARAREVLALGGVLTTEGRAATEAMDRDFIARGISPGGCSDLLAVTYFLFRMEAQEAKK